jgi:hypothetical protein
MSQNDVSDQPEKELDFLKPALVAGAVLAVVSTFFGTIGAFSQALNIVNVFCCIWISGSGALATHLLNKQRPGTLKYGDGAIVGAFAGVFAAVISTILGIPLRLMMSAQLQQAADQFKEQSAQMPPGFRDFFLQLMEPGINMTVILIGLIMGLILNTIFTTAGGALMVAILNRQKTE